MTTNSVKLPLICGWPAKHYPGYPRVCPCGNIFPERIAAEAPQWHRPPPDDMDFDTPAEDDLDFG